MTEQMEAKLLTGFEFLRHPDNPALGLLHLTTDTDAVWVLVTRKDLLSLAEIGLRHVDDLTAAPKEVTNIMVAPKESMQAKGRAKVRDAVRRGMGKPGKEEQPRPRPSRPRPSPRRTAH